MEIGIALRNARLDAGLSQNELARLMRVSQGYISDLEKGNRSFQDRYIDKLPEAMRPSVKAALRARYEALARSLSDE